MANLYNPSRDQVLRALGGRLRSERIDRGETQEIFGQRIGVSASTVKRMERGDPGVAIGQWLEAIDLLGRIQDIERVLASSEDLFLRAKKESRKRASRPIRPR